MHYNTYNYLQTIDFKIGVKCNRLINLSTQDCILRSKEYYSYWFESIRRYSSTEMRAMNST